jgi:hypothetical protein
VKLPASKVGGCGFHGFGVKVGKVIG